MSKISISDAARLTDISRTNLYKTYINTGKISVIRDSNRVYIDASELIRVFPNCKLNSIDKTHDITGVDDNEKQGNRPILTRSATLCKLA